MEKQMFKVITHIEKKNGGGYWMRLGSAFSNRDSSLNVYLDAVPKSLEFQIRPLDEKDLAKRAEFEARNPNHAPAPAAANPLPF